MDFVIPSVVTYDMDGRAHVAEVAKSILAQDRLLRDALVVVQKVFPDLELSGLEITVREVSHASPFRTMLVAFAAGVYSPGLGEDMPDILQALTDGRIDVPDSYDSFVSIILLVLAIYGIDKVRAKLFPSAEEKALAAEKERLLASAANKASVTRGAMREAVESVVGKRAGTVSKAAIDLLGPAKRHKARAIMSGGEHISEAAIEAMPSDVDLAAYEPPTKAEPLEGAVVKFRAHDLDKGKNWAATIEDVSPDRKPLHLAPDVRPEPLFGKRAVRADVIVTSLRDPDGDYIPSLYYLTKVYDDDAETSARAG